MINCIVGNIRKGKTSFLVCSVLKNCLSAEKLSNFKKSKQNLINNSIKKIESIDAILSSEGVMKKDSFKINNLNVYWECNAKILIPSDLLNNSLVMVN